MRLTLTRIRSPGSGWGQGVSCCRIGRRGTVPLPLKCPCPHARSLVQCRRSEQPAIGSPGQAEPGAPVSGRQKPGCGAAGGRMGRSPSNKGQVLGALPQRITAKSRSGPSAPGPRGGHSCTPALPKPPTPPHLPQSNTWGQRTLKQGWARSLKISISSWGAEVQRREGNRPGPPELQAGPGLGLRPPTPSPCSGHFRSLRHLSWRRPSADGRKTSGVQPACPKPLPAPVSPSVPLNSLNPWPHQPYPLQGQAQTETDGWATVWTAKENKQNPLGISAPSLVRAAGLAQSLAPRLETEQWFASLSRAQCS